MSQSTWLKNCDKVQEICSHLVDNSPISYFDYQRFYSDGKYLSLTTNPELIDAFLHHEIYPTSNELRENKSRIVLLSDAIELPLAAEDEQKWIIGNKISLQNKIAHRFYIVNNTQKFVETFCFGSNIAERRLIELFINNMSLWERFITYFNKQIKMNFKIDEEKKIVLPNFYKKISHKCEIEQLAIANNDLLLNILDHSNLNQFNSSSTAEKYPNHIKRSESELFSLKNSPHNILIQNFEETINSNTSKFKLTKREYECLIHYVRGYTTKEIAKKLCISPRTVETHLSNVKQKTGCTTKSTLRLLLI